MRLTARGVDVTRVASGAVATEWQRLRETAGEDTTLAEVTVALEALGRDGAPRPVW